MKITKRQLRKIIREERNRILSEMSPGQGVFSPDYIYDLIYEEVMNYSESGQVTEMEFDSIEEAVLTALRTLRENVVNHDGIN